MVIRVADVIFNDTPSKFNKDLVEFLKRNIETIVHKGQIKFRFKIATPSDLNGLRDKGIIRLPAMLIDGKPFISVPTIVNELQRRVKTSTTTAPAKTEEEVLDEYFKTSLGDIKKDGDGRIKAEEMDQEDENEGATDLTNAFHREIERRGNKDEGNKRGANRTPPEKPDRTAEQDDNFDNRRPPQQRGGDYVNARPQVPARPDNLRPASAGDPMNALNNMKAKGSGGGVDDDMMSALLLKMSSDD